MIAFIPNADPIANGVLLLYWQGRKESLCHQHRQKKEENRYNNNQAKATPKGKSNLRRPPDFEIFFD